MSDLTQARPGNPWVKEEMKYSRPEYILDVPAFAAALAEQLGATVENSEGGFAGSARITVGELSLYVRTEHGARFGKVKIFSGSPAAEKAIHYSERPKWPRGSFDTSRDIERLAADVKRRIVEASADALASLKGKIGKEQDHRDKLEAAAAKLRAEFPAAQVTIKDGPGVTDADVYLNASGNYVSGRLNADGTMCVDRIGSVDAGKLLRIFA